jgi:hypothetical protein
MSVTKYVKLNILIISFFFNSNQIEQCLYFEENKQSNKLIQLNFHYKQI